MEGHRAPAPARAMQAKAGSLALAVLLAVAGAGLAHAAEAGAPGDAGDPSICRPDGTQQQMNACAVRDYRAADAILNIRYREVMAALPAP
ncbi:MAG: DUF1311 domain-containing protein, partial [Variovorax sp.]